MFSRRLNKKELTMANEKKKLSTVPLNWKEVYYNQLSTGFGSNVDQELGWTKEEYKKIDINYLYLRARAENDWYPHYIHNLDNMIRFGGLFPPIHVHADIGGQCSSGDARPARGWRLDGTLPGQDLPDAGPERKEDRPLEEPQHHQDRLVAHPGTSGYRADADAQWNDHERCGDRRVPIPG